MSNFKVGDRVRHVVFGEGTVVEARPYSCIVDKGDGRRLYWSNLTIALIEEPITAERYIPQVGDVFEWRATTFASGKWIRRGPILAIEDGLVSYEESHLSFSDFTHPKYGFEARLVSRPEKMDLCQCEEKGTVHFCKDRVDMIPAVPKPPPHLSNEPVLNVVYEGWIKKQVPLTVSVNVKTFCRDFAIRSAGKILGALTDYTKSARINQPAPTCQACGCLADVEWKFDVAVGTASAFWKCNGEKK